MVNYSPMFIPRPSQQKILETVLTTDKPLRVGIAAVPGSGKTHILSYLASELIDRVNDTQEVLVVTLVNSAVDNFRRRVNSFIQAKGLLPGFNYRVCTLHSLAHELVRQRPALVGLSEDFAIVDEHTAQLILRDVTHNWLADNSQIMADYLTVDSNNQRIWRKDLPDLVLSIAQNFIRQAKDRGLTPYQLDDMFVEQASCLSPHDRQDACPTKVLPLARLGTDIYREYQHRLARTGVDFDDLIRLAAQALTLDPDYLARLQQQWPYILEDEAQDSSLLQEQILDKLAGEHGTWVRVGDPNQAIYETFTTANPQNLRQFLRRPEVISLSMPESGRSSASIIALANHLIEWTMQEHPLTEARESLQPPFVKAAPMADPQPNPPDLPHHIYLRAEKYQPDKEINTVVRSVGRWLAQNPDSTVAILDARNIRGAEVAKTLRQANIPHVELLNSTTATRSAAHVLSDVLRYLAHPEDAKLLAGLFRAWQRNDWDVHEWQPIFRRMEIALKKCTRLEEYVWPRSGRGFGELDDALGEIEKLNGARTPQALADEAMSDFESSLEDGTEDTSADAVQNKPPKPIQPRELLTNFREKVQRWQQAAMLPIDQLVLLLAQDLFETAPDLALSHKFALMLRQKSLENPKNRLADFAELLAEIARNQRRFMGFDEESLGFDPPKGKVTVSTMHRAKGLEWDRVYLLGLNNYSFPSGEGYDSYYSEKWYIRQSLNLDAEAIAQLTALVDHTNYIEGQATQRARFDLIRERLRLLFVGITRARQELVVTWNVGKEVVNKADNQPAIPFVALRTWWEQQQER